MCAARTFSQVYTATSRNDAHRGFALGTIEENSYRPHHLGYKPVDGTNRAAPAHQCCSTPATRCDIDWSYLCPVDHLWSYLGQTDTTTRRPKVQERLIRSVDLNADE
eukprot:1177831-Prorocentrum_minimum.AAC.8